MRLFNPGLYDLQGWCATTGLPDSYHLCGSSIHLNLVETHLLFPHSRLQRFHMHLLAPAVDRKYYVQLPPYRPDDAVSSGRSPCPLLSEKLVQSSIGTLDLGMGPLPSEAQSSVLVHSIDLPFVRFCLLFDMICCVVRPHCAAVLN